MVKVVLRSAYNFDRKANSDASGLACQEASRTVQSHKEECDINTIVRRFGVTGQLPASVRAPLFADFVEATDFQTSMNAIASAREAFDAMPAAVRDRFHNDPHEFVQFVNDDANRVEAEKLGLVLPQVAELVAGAPSPIVSGTPPAVPASPPVAQ